MTITVRRLEASDIPGLQQLATDVLRTQQPAAAERIVARVYSTESLQRTLSNTGVTLLLAIEVEQVVGCCRFGSPLFDDCLDRKEIHTLLVHPSADFVPIAAALLQSVEAHLRELPHVKRVSVYVDPAEADLIGFYGTKGYKHQPKEDTDGMWYLEKKW
ncbi:MAG: GNAT family N-acetyltransferase [Anaerolineae bacterium]|nr:GNAT family N-acetyltransferase [Anaerolineae bacterium]